MLDVLVVHLLQWPKRKIENYLFHSLLFFRVPFPAICLPKSTFFVRNYFFLLSSREAARNLIFSPAVVPIILAARGPRIEKCGKKLNLKRVVKSMNSDVW